MSTCISSHGEYSSHQLDATFTCTLCGVLDEDALSAELVRIQEELDGARNDHTMLREKQLRRAYEANDGLKARLKEREAEVDLLNAELAKLSRESARLLADYGARGMTIERLNAQMTEVSLVARRTADENDRLKAALASCVSDLRNAGYRLIEDARVLVAAVDALPSSSDGAGQTGCPNCGVLDEDALSAELVRLNAELADAKNELKATQNARLLSVVFGHHKGAPKPFVLQRRNGHAVVAVGAEFPDGAVALRLADDGGWTTASEGGAEHFCDDSTEIVWLSDELESLAEMELQRDRAVAELAEARRELDARDRYQEALAIGLSDYEAREEGWPTAAAPSSSDGDSQEIAERDFYHEVADILAAKVALLAGVDIGEHSNANNPWQNAIDAADRMIAATAPSSSDGAGLTGCPNCDGLDGTHTLRSCLAMADVERYRSFVAPGFDCPECLVDTGDSAHMVSCSIGQRLGCATRTDGAGQTDETGPTEVRLEVSELGGPLVFSDLPTWLTDAIKSGDVAVVERGEDYWYAMVRTAHGPVVIEPHDWILMTPDGHLGTLTAAEYKAAASGSAPAEEKA